ncbi:MAG: hypothetical protein ACTSU2_15210 [Promethearchaeota archaeon]
MSKFFKLFRKKGAFETLEVLYKFKKKEANQTDFFKEFKDQYKYINSFFRVKKDLLDYDLIAYKLNEENKKVITLTPKGKELLKISNDIENLFKINSNNGNNNNSNPSGSKLNN